MILIQCSILLLVVKSFVQKPLVYTFTIQKQTSRFSLYNTFLSSDKLCLGTPYQCLTVQFDPGTSLMIVLTKEYSSDNEPRETLYDKQKSSSFSLKNRFSKNYSSQKMIGGSVSSERMKFEDIEIEETYFNYAESWISDLWYSSIGISSLQDDRNHPNFIFKVSRDKETKASKYKMEIDYDESKGLITFEEDVNSTYAKVFSINSFGYYFGSYFPILNLIVSGNNNTNTDNMDNSEIVIGDSPGAMFDESFRFIQMPFFMNHSIVETFLINSDCTLKEYSQAKIYKRSFKHMYYVCKTDSIDTKALEKIELIFSLPSGNLTLRSEDLFEKYDDENRILNIIFRGDPDKDPQWVIGYPILKHYMIERNFDSGLITLYTKINVSSRDKPFTIRQIVKIYIGIMIIGLGYLIYVMRKIKSNYR